MQAEARERVSYKKACIPSSKVLDGNISEFIFSDINHFGVLKALHTSHSFRTPNYWEGKTFSENTTGRKC